MGDFVKGPIPPHYPEKIAQGLYLHRRIDSFSQTNPHPRNSRQCLHPKYGHGRGIVVDIFYDHFLASSWTRFHAESLEIYAKRIYLLLQGHHDNLPEGLQQVAPRMIEHNWLVSYQDQEVVGKALHRIAQRLSKPLPLDEATRDLAEHNQELRNDFEKFIDEARFFCCQEMNRDLYRDK
jgi:acyl carrier protein phosphodiesterase